MKQHHQGGLWQGSQWKDQKWYHKQDSIMLIAKSKDDNIVYFFGWQCKNWFFGTRPSVNTASGIRQWQRTTIKKCGGGIVCNWQHQQFQMWISPLTEKSSWKLIWLKQKYPLWQIEKQMLQQRQHNQLNVLKINFCQTNISNDFFQKIMK